MSDQPLEAELVIADKPYEPTALESINRGEIDVQISTAKRYPRSIVSFKRQALELATADEETAASCFYSLKRAGKKIEGPSVRLAEIAAYAWGNMRYGARIIDIQQKHVIAQGFAFDLEKNLASSVEIRRRITDSEGRRYSDDMITITANAACAIAFRQAIFKVLPQALLADVYKQSRETAAGKALTMEQRRVRIIADMAKVGASAEQVFKLVDAKGKDDITIDDILFLKGLITSIQDGETTLKTALSEGETVPATTKLGDLTETLKARQAAFATDTKKATTKEPISAADQAILDELK